tara:strand:+ start:112 stop:594 length:483 start_codon:yes stop_codon:yes gene_type:complete
MAKTTRKEFETAFDNARTRGQKTFTHKGERYTTDRKDIKNIPQFLDEKAQRKNKRKALGVTSTKKQQSKAVRQRLLNQSELRKEITKLRKENEIDLLTRPTAKGTSQAALQKRIDKLIRANKQIQDRPSEDIIFRNTQRPTKHITKNIQTARRRVKSGRR